MPKRRLVGLIAVGALVIVVAGAVIWLIVSSRSNQAEAGISRWELPDLNHEAYTSGVHAAEAPGSSAWYVYGRMQETGLIEPEKLEQAVNRLNEPGIFNDQGMEEWLLDAGQAELETGTKPREGALAIWNGPDLMHAAFVENLDDAGNILVTESNLDILPGQVSHVYIREETPLLEKAGNPDPENDEVTVLMPGQAFALLEGPVEIDQKQWFRLQLEETEGWACRQPSAGKTEECNFNFTGIQLKAAPPYHGQPDLYIYLNSAKLNLAALDLGTPEGGESFNEGDTVFIQWEANGVSSVLLELSRDGGQTWDELSSSSSDSYYWKVTGPPTEEAFIRISSRVLPTLSAGNNISFIISGPGPEAPQPQDLDIPDPVLRGVLHIFLKQEKVTTEALQKLNRLDYTGSTGAMIKSLAGLEHAANITRIEFSANEINDLGPLRELKQLTILCLDSNRITDISPLAGLTGLRELNLRDNSIHDITPLRELSGLKWLFLGENQIQDISVLLELKELEVLNLSDMGLDEDAEEVIDTLRERGVNIIY